MLLEGRLVGSLAQGLGGALLEEFRYDANGSPLSVPFADYLMPTLKDVPNVEVLITEDAPSPVNPLGLKGGAEAGITAVAPALAAAIDDAIGTPGAIVELPITPQRLKRIIDESLRGL
jgi:CO/xanthine dehydrogenase Mo-binding subunit